MNFFDKQQTRDDDLVAEIEGAFINISKNIRSSKQMDEKERELDISLFRKCTQIVSLAPENEYKILKFYQKLFYRVYLAKYWSPTTLNKILLLYSDQWSHCYRFVCASKTRIAQMLQLTGAATNHKAIMKLLQVFTSDIWNFADETQSMLLDKNMFKKKKPKRLSFGTSRSKEDHQEEDYDLI